MTNKQKACLDASQLLVGVNNSNVSTLIDAARYETYNHINEYVLSSLKNRATKGFIETFKELFNI